MSFSGDVFGKSSPILQIPAVVDIQARQRLPQGSVEYYRDQWTFVRH
jgi:hypothetical protein